MTGLIVPSGLPWDTPNAWTLEARVTFDSQLRRRTDQVEMRVVADPGDSRLAVQAKARAVFAKICAVEATVTRMRPPMDAETIAFLQEFNAQLQRDRHAAQAAYDRDHEEALARNAECGARAPAEREEAAAMEPQEKQLVFA